MRQALVLLLVAAGLAACGPRVISSDVTRFHNPDLLSPANQTFTITPREQQVGSLEFQRYAEIVARRLSARGLQPVAPGAGPADLVVRLDYGLEGPRTEIQSRPVTGSVGFSRWHDPWAFGFGMPLYSEIDTRQVYTRWLRVEMLDGDALRAGRRDVLFEGRAVSTGTASGLPAMMPYLAAALFESFPGTSGQTVRVQVPVDEAG